jgi:hypothetical protein
MLRLTVRRGPPTPPSVSSRPNASDRGLLGALQRASASAGR